MLKGKWIKIVSVLVIVLCVFLLVACGKEPSEGKETPIETQSSGQTQTQSSGQTQTQSSGQTQTQSSGPAKQDSSTQQTESESQANDVIAKIAGASDESGIYSILLTLSDKIADKGEVEMVYYGAKGSAQENSVVNTFLIQYYKEDAGTFEVKTFSDGEVYQNYHHQEIIKVNNTFGATVRAESVIIYYTPDGGETQEIYSADADQFR